MTVGSSHMGFHDGLWNTSVAQITSAVCSLCGNGEETVVEHLFDLSKMGSRMHALLLWIDQHRRYFSGLWEPGGFSHLSGAFVFFFSI